MSKMLMKLSVLLEMPLDSIISERAINSILIIMVGFILSKVLSEKESVT